MNISTYVNAMLLICSLSLFSCHSEHGVSSKDKYKQLTKKSPAKVSVKRILNKDDFIHWQYSAEEMFYVKKTWNKSKEQSCKNCHQGYSLKNIKGTHQRRAHWHIKLKHASEKIMKCQTCHNQEQVWLFNFDQQRIQANYAPKLCIQCHYQQEKDWESGAHGKRVNGWQYERAVYNCVYCHNPHDPSFKKKWPRVAPYRIINSKERL